MKKYFFNFAGSAQLIEFNPLKCTPVILPDGAIFVVANSLVEKNKAVGSDYNTRVVECRLACRIIAKNSSKNKSLCFYTFILLKWRLVVIIYYLCIAN